MVEEVQIDDLAAPKQDNNTQVIEVEEASEKTALNAHGGPDNGREDDTVAAGEAERNVN